MAPTCPLSTRALGSAALTVAFLIFARPTFAAPNPLPTVRASGIGIATVAYGPQVPQTATLVALSQAVVVSDSASTASLHAANPTLCLLSYLCQNLCYYYPYYAEAQRTETAFLHAADPAYLGASLSPGAALLSWLPDARVRMGYSTVTGYQVWRQTGTGGTFQLLATTAPTVTQYSDTGLSTGTTYGYAIMAVDATWGARAYSDTTQVVGSSTTPAGIVCTGVTVTQPDSISASTKIMVSASTSITALDLWFDVNRNRAFDPSERQSMSKNGVDPLGRQQWIGTFTTSEPKQLWGIAGHEWYVTTAAGGGPSARCPADSFHSSNPNNRIRGWDWGPWLMNLSDTTWTRILVNAGKAVIKTGPDGLFFDTAVTSPMMLSPDASMSPRVIAAYPADMRALLGAIKTAISPASLMFNGLNTASLPYTEVTDGGMTEGFVAQTWKPGLATSGTWWGYMMDAELTAQATRNSTIFNVGLGYDAPVSVRMYALASHLLVANTRTFYYYYANISFTYYPEMDITIGSPLQSFARVADAKRPSGLYGRSYTGGMVLVNSSDTQTITETLPAPMAWVTPNGGVIPMLGGTGSLSASWVTSVSLPPLSGAVLLNAWGGAMGLESSPALDGTGGFVVGPTPARSALTLHAAVPRAGRVRAMLFAVDGRSVTPVVDELIGPGAWTHTLDLRRQALPAGVYLMRLESTAGIATRRVVLLGSGVSSR